MYKQSKSIIMIAKTKRKHRIVCIFIGSCAIGYAVLQFTFVTVKWENKSGL